MVNKLAYSRATQKLWSSHQHCDSLRGEEKGKVFLGFFFFKDFIYLFLEKGKGGRKRGRETLMCERNTDWLPLVCPELGTLPET